MGSSSLSMDTPKGDVRRDTQNGAPKVLVAAGHHPRGEDDTETNALLPGRVQLQTKQRRTGMYIVCQWFPVLACSCGFDYKSSDGL
jgi:hypothetical protein